ncbi:MAG TPA: type II toxin-antitoxin system prevent-host-death family antitoxin [Methylomirabilota bacterium]|jgi:prevent-host-death family protein|nr:type II toxin-antitoxin system prevent-host-death family antitoxin [Methylomirabilota bacterium]
MTQLTITKAREALLDLPERLAKASDKTVSITRHGRPVLAVLPWELYESIIETLEVLGDPEATAALRSSLEDIRKGRLVSHEVALKRIRG